MARGTTLETLIEQLRSECRFSTNAGNGVNNLPYLKQLLRRYYEFLYDEYEWPFSRIKRGDAGKTLAAGQRYYDFPATLDLNHAHSIWYKDGSQWRRLTHGIGTEQYSVFDSDDDVRSDPPMRWDYYDKTQFEIWPLPATNGTADESIRFEGRRLKNALTLVSDTCDIDDQVVVLFAAAEILKGTKQGDADEKKQMAVARINQLRLNLSSQESISLGPVTDVEGNGEGRVPLSDSRFLYATKYNGND